MIRFSLLLRGMVSTLVVTAALAGETAYDPLAIAVEAPAGRSLDLSVTDSARAQQIPLRVYLPASTQPAPVILFSHGLGGSRENNPYLGRHWSARGYVVVVLQHAGSDESVWAGLPPGQRLAALKRAANLDNALLRFQDVRVVIDQLERWQVAADSPLAGRLDLSRLGMSGHSFGAVTTQGVSGQRTARGTTPFADDRIKASVMMSPSSPKSAEPKTSFGAVKIPWLLMTGTKDEALVGDADVPARLAVFPALPPGGKYELVLDGARHEAFSDRELGPGQPARNPQHHRVILALSTAFWDAWLRGDPAARAWLDGEGPATVLAPADRWQKK